MLYRLMLDRVMKTLRQIGLFHTNCEPGTKAQLRAHKNSLSAMKQGLVDAADSGIRKLGVGKEMEM